MSGLCPLCRGDAANLTFPYATHYAGREFAFFKCAGCQTSFIDPQPDQAVLEQMYAPVNYHAQFYADMGNVARPANSKMMALLAAHMPKGARVLDFGCGTGDFILAAKAMGYDVCGAEFGADAAADASKRCGVPVYNLLEDAWLVVEKWDCVHLGDVIEHLVAPLDMVQTILSRINAGGILAAQGPLEANPSLVFWSARLVGWVKRVILRKRAAGFPPYHLFFANKLAQRAFFARLGLREVHWEMAEDGWPYSGNGFVRGLIATMARGLARLPLLKSCLGNRFYTIQRLK